MVREIFMNVPAMLCLTVGAFLLGVWIRNKTKISLLHPFVICIPTIITILVVLEIPYDYYMESNNFINFLLGPSVVSLGLMMYDERKIIKANLVPMLVSVLIGSIVGVVSVYLLSMAFGLNELFMVSLAPKSVTTPIAIDLSAATGGNISLTVVSVVLCGFIGAVFGALLVRILRIKSPVAKGLALGTASHALGTSRAIEIGALEGAVSGLAIALMGLATALVLPLINSIFF